MSHRGCGELSIRGIRGVWVRKTNEQGVAGKAVN